MQLRGLPRPALAAVLAGVVDRPFRVEQIYRALHQRGVESFDEISDLPQALRQELAARFTIGRLHLAAQEPASDGSAKLLFELADGATIEAVDIPDGDRRTLCVSSQAGCALACKFCVTGFWGAGRNLTSGEIVGQVTAIRRLRGLPATGPGSGLNLVFMGMGEPLLNLEGLEAALEVLTETTSYRRITVSTAGVVPGIEAMARWPAQPNLAISLHAPDDARRDELMPINRTYPLAALIGACRAFPRQPGRKITFEYLLIRDFNDGQADADALVRLLAHVPAKVNLIPINPDPVLGDRMVPPPPTVVDQFQARLREKGIIATVRRRRGDEVSAACGQLRAFGRNPRGFRLGSVS